MTVATRRTAAVVVCAATALALSTPATQAQELTNSDGTNDVWVASVDSAGFTRAPGSNHADVTSVVLRHGAKRVVLTAKLAELTKRGAEVVLLGQFRTNTGLLRDAMLFGQVGIRSGYVEFSNRTGKAVLCDIAHKIDYAANTMMMSVPRSCLNNPSYVEFRSQTSWVTSTYEQVYVDNPHNAKAEFTGWSNRVSRG